MKITGLLLVACVLLGACSARVDSTDGSNSAVATAEPGATPTAAVVPTATAAPVEPTEPTVVATPDETVQDDRERRYEGADPIAFTVGQATGVTPDRAALVTVDNHPSATLSCEASPALALWRQPFDGSARSLMSEREVLSGGITDWSVQDGRALWMEYCDGYGAGPFVAPIEPDGTLGEETQLEIDWASDEPWTEFSSPRWTPAGAIEIRVAGSETVLVLDPTSGTVIERLERSLDGDTNPWGSWIFDELTQRWVSSLDGVELTVPGLAPDALIYGPPIVDDELGLAFVSVPGGGPSWTQVLAIRLDANVTVRSALGADTPLTGQRPDTYEPLAPLRNGSEWLVQEVDPVDDCSAELVVTSLDGSARRPVIDGQVPPIHNLVVNGDQVSFVAGCRQGPWSIGHATLGADEWTLQGTSAIRSTYPVHLYDVSVDGTTLRSTLGPDARLELDLTTGAVRTLGAGRLDLQLADAQVRFSLPAGWSANAVQEGVAMTHPSGATIVVAETDRLDLEPDFESLRESAGSAFDVATYNVGTYGEPADPVRGEIWQTPDASLVIVALRDRWVYLAASGPTDDPAVAQAVDEAVDRLMIGSTE